MDAENSFQGQVLKCRELEVLAFCTPPVTQAVTETPAAAPATVVVDPLGDGLDDLFNECDENCGTNLMSPQHHSGRKLSDVSLDVSEVSTIAFGSSDLAI